VWVRDGDLCGCPGGGGCAGAVRPNVAAIVIYLYVGQFLSKDRTALALAELFGTPIVSTMSRLAGV
jgi:transposase